MIPAVATEEWLARWREASQQCWARPGTCCDRFGCRVERLSAPVSDAEPPTEPYADSAHEAASVALSPGNGPIPADSTTDETRRAAA